MDKRTQFHIWYVVAALIGILVVQQVWTQSHQTAVIPYSQFLTDLKAGNLDEVRVSGNYIQGTLKKAPEGGQKNFVTTRVPPDIAGQLQQQGVKFSGQVQSTFLSDLLSWVVPTLLFFGLWVFLMRRMAGSQGLGGGLMAVGKSKAKIYVETDTKVTFDDVAGVDEAKEELKEVVDFLKTPRITAASARTCRRACCWSGRPAPARRCWRARSRARRACRSSRSAARNSSRCSSASAPRACATCSSRRAPRRPPSSSSTSSTRLAARAAPIPGRRPRREGADAQPAPGPSSTASIRRAAWSCWRPPTGRRSSIPRCLRAGRFDRQVLVDRPDKPAASHILKVHLQKATAGAPTSIAEKIAGADARLHRRRSRQPRQ